MPKTQTLDRRLKWTIRIFVWLPSIFFLNQNEETNRTIITAAPTTKTAIIPFFARKPFDCFWFSAKKIDEKRNHHKWSHKSEREIIHESWQLNVRIPRVMASTHAYKSYVGNQMICGIIEALPHNPLVIVLDQD